MDAQPGPSQVATSGPAPTIHNGLLILPRVVEMKGLQVEGLHLLRQGVCYPNGSHRMKLLE